MGEDHQNEFLQELVSDIVTKNEGFTDVKYTFTKGSNAGDNFVGVIHRITAEGRSHDNKKQVVSFIVKCMPDSQERRKQFGSNTFFDNEIVFYDQIIPTFEEFQRERVIPDKDRLNSLPKCFRTLINDDNHFLVLEDVSPLGFVMEDRIKGLSAEHCLMVGRELGKLHALSFAFRDQKPEEFERLSGKVVETIFKSNSQPGASEHTTSSTNNVSAALLMKVPKDSKYVQRFKNFSDNCMEILIESAKGSLAEPYAVICHGDCWTNNMLFKRAENGVTPEAMIFLDFQLSRYSSPVTDLSYFLYCCTTGTVRRKVYNSFLKTYYDSLSHFLSALGSDPSKLFPYSAFKEQVQKFSVCGLGMAIMAMQLFTNKTEETVDTDQVVNPLSLMAKISPLENPVYVERITDVVFDMVDHGFI
uniref:CHK kinase-like domain-containing protein n=1 Tax=Timema shepardi TaxID=629360 RepID=A0A7R9FXL2_TIMSH|nr:unnamed protein product [Timema shepardi]